MVYSTKRTNINSMKVLTHQGRHNMAHFLQTGGIIIAISNYVSTFTEQSGRSPKVVAFFSATNFSSYIIEFFSTA